MGFRKRWPNGYDLSAALRRIAEDPDPRMDVPADIFDGRTARQVEASLALQTHRRYEDEKAFHDKWQRVLGCLMPWREDV